MSVTVEQVPVWLILDGIGHAVQGTNCGWFQTGCGTLTPGGTEQKEVPKRICRRCRERLKEATLLAPTSPAATQAKPSGGAR
jgi:hypothetical protein